MVTIIMLFEEDFCNVYSFENFFLYSHHEIWNILNKTTRTWHNIRLYSSYCIWTILHNFEFFSVLINVPLHQLDVTSNLWSNLYSFFPHMTQWLLLADWSFYICLNSIRIFIFPVECASASTQKGLHSLQQVFFL